MITDLQQVVIDNIANINESEAFSPPIPRETVMAFCEIESSFNPYAYRFEQKLGEASWGLMQILQSTAKDRGFDGEPTALYTIDENLLYGMRQLSWIRDFIRSHAPDLPFDDFCLAAAYNAGVGNVIHGFRPAGYVAAFTKARQKWTDELGD